MRKRGILEDPCPRHSEGPTHRWESRKVKGVAAEEEEERDCRRRQEPSQTADAGRCLGPIRLLPLTQF